MTDQRRRPSLGDWVWNFLLYPIAFAILTVVTVLMSRAGIGAQAPDQGVISMFVGRWTGLLFYWTPGVVAAIAILVVVSRLLDPQARRSVAVVTPVSVVAAWIVMLFSSGYEFVYLAAGPGSITIEGWIATAVAVLTVGVLTRVAPQRNGRELGDARRTP